MLKRIIIFPLKKLFRLYKEYKFYIRTGIYAQGINYTGLHSLFFEGKNSIGKNCKIISQKSDTSGPSFIIKNNSWIGDNVEINIPANGKVHIGNNSSVQDGCKILGDVYIGAFTLFAPNVFVSSGNHFAFLRPHLTIREQDKLSAGTNEKTTPIYIEDDCWIGKNVFIKPGTYIGRGSVIGLGAIAKGYIPPYSVVVDKSKIIKNRVDFIPSDTIRAEEFSIPYFYRGFNPSVEDIENGCFFCKKEGLLIFSSEKDCSEISIQGISVCSGSQSIDFYINGNLISSSVFKEGPFKSTLKLPENIKAQSFSFEKNPEQLKEFNVVYCISQSDSSDTMLGIISIKIH
jgi:acetyltransferase-like isoleucine patch superfamily enzyme